MTTFLEYLEAEIELLEENGARSRSLSNAKAVRKLYLEGKLDQYWGKYVAVDNGEIIKVVDDESDFDKEILAKIPYISKIDNPEVYHIGGSSFY